MKVPIHDKVGIFPKYLRRNAILCPKWKFALTRNETRYVANGINSSNGIRFCKVSFLHRWTKFLSLQKTKKGDLLRIIQSFFWEDSGPVTVNQKISFSNIRLLISTGFLKYPFRYSFQTGIKNQL